ncbi:hypothetical protein, partial [Escherichia coli]|uniref:hypothetical protein n=1 Tax=Escherichia coli TaxID=562 RepID=UPI0028771714
YWITPSLKVTLRLFARNVSTPRLLAVTPYITGADKCSFSNPVEFCQTGADTQESTPAPV